MYIPPKEVIAEELDFDDVERKFYDNLVARGQQVIEEMKNSQGGLSKNYMCLLTMLLRLRQGTPPPSGPFIICLGFPAYLKNYRASSAIADVASLLNEICF